MSVNCSWVKRSWVQHSSVIRFLALPCLLALAACMLPVTEAAAQTPAAETTATAQPNRIYKLQHESTKASQDLGDAGEVEIYKPGIRPGTIELSMSLGFMNLSSTLLEHDQMIYKYTTEFTSWGDVKITGQSAFSPTLRIGYTLKPWLTLEGYGGTSISEYTSTVENRHQRKNEAGAVPEDDPPLGEFDAEARSLITIQTGIGAVVYPFKFSNDGAGRWQPNLTALAGFIWYDMNSDFTAGGAGTSDMALGGGLRLMAERNVSLRLEATYHVNSLTFDPAEYFAETDEGTTKVPLMEYPVTGDGGFSEQPIEEFSTQDMNYMAWSIGFQGTF